MTMCQAGEDERGRRYYHPGDVHKCLWVVRVPEDGRTNNRVAWDVVVR